MPDALPLTRRSWLATGALMPLLSSCASVPRRYSTQALPDLPRSEAVCAASHVILRGGRPGAPTLLSGCAAAALPAEPVFQAASLTKPLVALVALTLARDGRLDLDAPVSHHLPDGYAHRQRPFSRNKDQDKASPVDHVPAATLARIPVRSLLNHSAGLPNWTSAALTPAFEPGTRWQYSGEGYLLLQAVLAALTGQDLAATVSALAFQPLGMRDSRLSLTDDLRGRVVDGSTWLGTRQRFDFDQPNAAASLYTTAADYARLMAALLADARLLAMTVDRPVPTEPAMGLWWCQGWGLLTAPGGPYLWQWGNNPGFRAFAMVSASTGDGFVLLTNSERGLRLAPALVQATVPAAQAVFGFRMLDL